MTSSRRLAGSLVLAVAALGGTPGVSAAGAVGREPRPPVDDPLPDAAIEVLTAGAQADQPLPLVIGLHGRGGSPERFAAVLGRLGVQARVVVLPGPFRAGKGRAWFRPRARSRDRDTLTRAIVEASDRVAASIADIVATRPTCGRPIVVGFSQGGMVALALAAEHPELAAHVIPIAGWVPQPVRPEGISTAITAIHGTADRTVPYRWARDMIASMQARGVDARLVTQRGIGHDVRPAVRREALRLAAASITPCEDHQRAQ